MKLERIAVLIKFSVMNELPRVIYAHEKPIYELIHGAGNVKEDNTLDMPIPLGLVVHQDGDLKGEPVEVDPRAEYSRMMNELPRLKSEKETRHPVELVYRSPADIEDYLADRGKPVETKPASTSNDNTGTDTDTGSSGPKSEKDRMKEILKKKGIKFNPNLGLPKMRILLMKHTLDGLEVEYAADATEEVLTDLLNKAQNVDEEEAGSE